MLTAEHREHLRTEIDRGRRAELARADREKMELRGAVDCSSCGIPFVRRGSERSTVCQRLTCRTRRGRLRAHVRRQQKETT